MLLTLEGFKKLDNLVLASIKGNLINGKFYIQTRGAWMIKTWISFVMPFSYALRIKVN